MVSAANTTINSDCALCEFAGAKHGFVWTERLELVSQPERQRNRGSAQFAGVVF